MFHRRVTATEIQLFSSLQSMFQLFERAPLGRMSEDYNVTLTEPLIISKPFFRVVNSKARSIYSVENVFFSLLVESIIYRVDLEIYFLDVLQEI